VTGSNIGWGTDYPEEGSSWFYVVPSGKHDATTAFFDILC
jgi:hypothetical protein